MRRPASPIFPLLPVLVSLLGCGGGIVLQPDEEVTPGGALGFTYITYYSFGVITADTTETLEVNESGRTWLGRSGKRLVYRFLPDAELLELRNNVHDAAFFSWGDTTFGDPTARPYEFVVFEDERTRVTVSRHDFAPVPAEIETLFEQMHLFIDKIDRYGRGTALPVGPVVRGRTTRIDSPSFFVVRSRDALLDLLWRMGSNEVTVIPSIDFDREMIVAAFLGRSARRTAEITFEDVAYVHEGVVRVRYSPTAFPDACGLRVMPFALARVPRFDLPVEFYESTDSTFTSCE
jgi:hypothetical protein